MKEEAQYHLEIEIDKLTDCIVNKISGEAFQTEVIKATHKDFKQVLKKNKWKFKWKDEFKIKNRTIYKLTIVKDAAIQGLMSVEEMTDHLYLHLVESAPLNYGYEKVHEGVGGNLFAFCCRLSFDNGNEGMIAFKSKTNLIGHYVHKLGATYIGKQNMIIYPEKALIIDK